MVDCWGKLDAWQQEGVTWMLAAEKAAEEGRGFVVADRMGSGKTHQFAAFLKVSALTPGEATLIICPSTCVTSWRDTLRMMTGHPPYILVPGCRARIMPGEGDVVLASHSFFRTPPCKSMCSAAHVADLLNVEWGRVIVDEAHAVLRQGSMSRQLLDRVEARVRWAITGCSADGALARHFKDVTLWTRSRDQEILQRRGSDTAVTSIVHRLPFATEAEQWLSDRVHELKRGGGPEAHLRCRQVSAGFRVFMHAVQMQTVSEKELSGYCRKCADLLRLFLEKYERFSMNSRNVGTKASYIRDAIVASSRDMRFIVFCTWCSEAETVKTALVAAGVNCVVMTGKLPPTTQTAILDSFNDDDAGPRAPKVLIVTVGVGCLGVNLQAADHVIVTTPQQDPFVEAQAYARVDRKGQHRIPTMTRLIACGTVDEDILRARTVDEDILRARTVDDGEAKIRK